MGINVVATLSTFCSQKIIRAIFISPVFITILVVQLVAVVDAKTLEFCLKAMFILDFEG
jgi:hypothetical protein